MNQLNASMNRLNCIHELKIIKTAMMVYFSCSAAWKNKPYTKNINRFMKKRSVAWSKIYSCGWLNVTHSFFSCQTRMKILTNLCVFFRIISQHEKFSEIGGSHEKKNRFMKKNKVDSMKIFNRFMKKIDQIHGFPSSMKKNKYHENFPWKKQAIHENF